MHFTVETVDPLAVDVELSNEGGMAAPRELVES